MIGNEVSKEDAAAYLRNQGLKAEVSGGVVVVYMPLADALKPKAMDKLFHEESRDEEEEA